MSREEIQSIINAISNKKHKLLISVAYGAGLRVSEVMSLKVKDVDLNELQSQIPDYSGMFLIFYKPIS